MKTKYEAKIALLHAITNQIDVSIQMVNENPVETMGIATVNELIPAEKEEQELFFSSLFERAIQQLVSSKLVIIENAMVECNTPKTSFIDMIIG
jgi:hypothetical protein